jgi:hypothetical protein
MVVYHSRISARVTTSRKLWYLISKTIIVVKEYHRMLEALFIFVVIGNIAIGVTKEVIIPVANKAIEVTVPVVEKVVDYVSPEKPEE